MVTFKINEFRILTAIVTIEVHTKDDPMKSRDDRFFNLNKVKICLIKIIFIMEAENILWFVVSKVVLI